MMRDNFCVCVFALFEFTSRPAGRGRDGELELELLQPCTPAPLPATLPAPPPDSILASMFRKLVGDPSLATNSVTMVSVMAGGRISGNGLVMAGLRPN